MKTPNNIHSVGDERDRLSPNPKANSLADSDNYFKLGVVYALSTIMFESLQIDVPTIFWKYLLQSSGLVMKPGLEWEDIQKVNLNQYNCLEKIKTLADDELEYLDQTFTTYLSDGKEFELFPNGSKVKVDVTNRVTYIELCKQVHMAELLKPFASIRRGFKKFAPGFVYSLITPVNMEAGIVGIKGVHKGLTPGEPREAKKHNKVRRVRYRSVGTHISKTVLGGVVELHPRRTDPLLVLRVGTNTSE